MKSTTSWHVRTANETGWMFMCHGRLESPLGVDGGAPPEACRELGLDPGVGACKTLFEGTEKFSVETVVEQLEHVLAGAVTSPAWRRGRP